MTEPRDPRPLFAAAADQARAVVGAVTPADLDRPTPCAEFDVRHLLGHLLAVALRAEATATGADTRSLPFVITDRPDDELMGAFAGAAARAVAAWADDALLARSFTLPWGEQPGAVAVAAFVNELTVHGWDLATAVDWEGRLDGRLAEASLEFARRGVPAEARVPGFPFGPVVEVSDDADPYQRLAGWLGRRDDPVAVP